MHRFWNKQKIPVIGDFLKKYYGQIVLVPSAVVDCLEFPEESTHQKALDGFLSGACTAYAVLVAFATTGAVVTCLEICTSIAPRLWFAGGVEPVGTANIPVHIPPKFPAPTEQFKVLDE